MGQSIYIFVALFVGLLAGATLSWLVQRERLSAAVRQIAAESQIELARLSERLIAVQVEGNRLTTEYADLQKQTSLWRDQLDASRDECAKLQERATGLSEQLIRLQQEKDSLVILRDQLTAEQRHLSNQLAELNSMLVSERSQTEEKLQLLKNAEEQLSNRFKMLASEILEDKTKRFTEQNQTNLNQLLEPLKVKLTEFQGKVEEVYVNEGKDRSALAEQVKQLMVLNNQLSKDAHNLTSALKGQAKAQGNWGELILERVLEASGLRKGHEYDVQENHTREDGTRAQPDVVVHLPEDRHLIIDAKVSLTAYEAHANAETELQRDTALKRHLDSVRAHIKELAEKNYQQLYGLQSLDFVLMFIPVEPAFMLAVSHDSNLWQDAWKKNVLLVSPSTLLFVVRTVAHLWRQEQQNRNAQEIAKRGAELYDKLVGFVDDLDKLGDRLNQAKDVYDKAYGKFTSGRSNVIRQAEQLKGLGVKPTKQLPQHLIESAREEDGQTRVSAMDETVLLHDRSGNKDDVG
ncbi:MAG: DNA recombination protein RmuC [Gallionella sp.]|jgi:DNA recombination protein RmuC|nr:DNA recombination protein RmuC [Gallionella sp.]